MLRLTWPLVTTSCTCYATEDAVQIVNSFLTIFTHTELQSLTIIYHAVSHLHSLQSHTFVTTISYYTLTLADFSAIKYCLKLSHTLHLHTLKLSPKSYSANSLLKTPLENLLTTYYLPSIVQVSLQQRARWELCCVRSLCLHGVASETSVLPCDVIAAARRPRVPYCAREAFSGLLPSNALLRNPTMGWHVTIFKHKFLKISVDLQTAIAAEAHLANGQDAGVATEHGEVTCTYVPSRNTNAAYRFEEREAKFSATKACIKETFWE
jgi:hypothetical protein